MCRNIRTLYNFEPPVTSEEVHDAALQYVRKISRFTQPSQANEIAFERLLDELVTTAPPKNREAEAAKKRRWEQRAAAALPKSAARPALPRLAAAGGCRGPAGSRTGLSQSRLL
jgi:hypothetical protein